MIPLLSLLAALVLTQAPAVLTDDLKEDSSGEQPSRGPLSLLYLRYGRKSSASSPGTGKETDEEVLWARAGVNCRTGMSWGP